MNMDEISADLLLKITDRKLEREEDRDYTLIQLCSDACFPFAF
jgi:hypothetical protein